MKGIVDGSGRVGVGFDRMAQTPRRSEPSELTVTMHLAGSASINRGIVPTICANGADIFSRSSRNTFSSSRSGASDDQHHVPADGIN